MKQNTVILLILGILIAVTIYSLWKLNSISKGTTTNSNATNSGGRFADTQSSIAETNTTMRQDVSASELSNAVREKLKKQQIKELNITFTE